MSKEEMSEVEQALQNKVVNMEQNQAALVKQNEELYATITKMQQGKMIFSKMLAVKEDIGSVGKDQTNSFQGFKFRGIDQFINHLHPILNKHGVGISTKVLQQSEEYKEGKNGKMSKNVRIIMGYTFFAEDGSSVECQMPAEGIDTSDKATNKALSAALKYCLIQTFCVPTEDMAIPDSESVQLSGDEIGAGAKKKAPKKKAEPKKEAAKSSFRKKKAAAPVEDEEDDD